MKQKIKARTSKGLITFVFDKEKFKETFNLIERIKLKIFCWRFYPIFKLIITSKGAQTKLIKGGGLKK